MKWEIKKLGELCEIVNGSTPLRTNKDFWENGNFPWFTIDDIRTQGRVITATKQKVTEAALSKLKVLPIDTVLLCCTASVGEYAITKIELTTNQQFNGLVVKDKDQLHPEFLMYYCSALKDRLLELSGKTTIDFIAISKIKNLNIPLPPLSEQKRIVAILDQAFEVIAKAKENTEQNLKNAKELFESYLQLALSPSKSDALSPSKGEVFDGSASSPTNKGDDWEEKIIKEVCELKSGTTISTNLERSKGDVLYIKVGDMTLPENEIEINTSSRFVNSNEIKFNQIIPSGAIIFPKRGGAIATNKKRKIVKPTIVDLNTMAIIPGDKIDTNYFFHWFALIDLNDISNGTSIPQINNYSFDDVKISFPKSKIEQQTIVRQLDALRAETQKLEAIYTQKLSDLEELKKSLLQKAFAGELVK
jgi:restriction endonuclease S subunit